MSQTIVYVDQSTIREGKFEALKKGIRELVQFIDENEPQLIAYNVYFSEDRTQMTVVHVHTDAASLEFHMEVAGRMFPRFSEFIQLQSIDIFGKLEADLVQQLKAKAEMLGSGAVRVHDHHAGVNRFLPR